MIFFCPCSILLKRIWKYEINDPVSIFIYQFPSLNSLFIVKLIMNVSFMPLEIWKLSNLLVKQATTDREPVCTVSLTKQPDSRFRHTNSSSAARFKNHIQFAFSFLFIRFIFLFFKTMLTFKYSFMSVKSVSCCKTAFLKNTL